MHFKRNENILDILCDKHFKIKKLIHEKIYFNNNGSDNYQSVQFRMQFKKYARRK